MERKFIGKACLLPLIASAFSLSLSSCAPTAEFKSDVKRQKVRYESAARRTFTPGRSVSDEVSYSFLPDSALQSLHLKAAAPDILALKQFDRPKAFDQFTQGHRGSFVQEEFAVATLDKLDLLLVVDNSSSMGPYQDRLANGLTSLLSHISNTDWRMMVTTTSAVKKRDPQNPTEILKIYGCPRLAPLLPDDKPIITRDDYVADPTEVDARFAGKIKIGESGDPIEHGLLAAVEGLKGECGQSDKAWTRPDSHKVVLILTDEENCGSDPDQNCDADLDSDPQFFLDRAPAKTQLFALLHDHDKYAQCADDGYIRKPDDYRRLIAETGGLEGNICEGRYEETLEKISKNMVPVTRLEYNLSFKPATTDITLMLDGRPWNGNYVVEGQGIRIESPLPEGGKVLTIGYRHDPIPMSRKFPLSTSIDPETLLVRVNGESLGKESYSIENGSIVFASEPPELAKIDFSYRDASPLSQVFPLPEDADLDTVKVSVNGFEIPDFRIVGEKEEIWLPKAPEDAASIRISYEKPSSRTLRYPALSLPDGQILGVSAVDGQSREPIAVERVGSELVFQRPDVQDQRAVEILYSLRSDVEELALDLPQAPKDGSLQIRSSESGEQCVANMSTEGAKLVFPCPPAALGHLQIRYDYVGEIDEKFLVEGRFTSDCVWKVKVDGAETKEFEVHDNWLSFPGRALEAGTLIEVEVMDVVRE